MYQLVDTSLLKLKNSAQAHEYMGCVCHIFDGMDAIAD